MKPSKDTVHPLHARVQAGGHLSHARSGDKITETGDTEGTNKEIRILPLITRPEAHHIQTSVQSETLGRHLLIELRKCCPRLLVDIDGVQRSMEQTANLIGATIVKSVFHHFAPLGVSGVVVIKESHVAIHTWPEFGYAALDIFTCGPDIHPEQAIDFVMNTFQAEEIDIVECYRSPRSISVFAPPANTTTINTTAINTTATKTRPTNTTHSKAATTRPYTSLKSPNKGHDSERHGVGSSSCEAPPDLSGRDDQVIDEMLAHVPLLALPELRTTCIIDSRPETILQQVKKHPHIESHSLLNSLKDLHRHPPTDLILIKHPCQMFPQFSTNEDYYYALRDSLTPRGLIVSVAPSLLPDSSLFQDQLSMLKAQFGPEHVTMFTAAASLGYVFFVCSKNSFPSLSEINYKRAEVFVKTNCLYYYTPAIHKAAFTLPAFLKHMLL